ncbi:hypothetical protein CWI39_3011p0010, partial [Hamiltosporidium magnivora]
PKIVSCKNRQEKEILIEYLTTGHNPAEYSKEERGAVFGFETALIKQIIQTEHAVAHIGEYIKECEACSRFDSLKTIQPVYINHITKKYDLFMMDCVDLRRDSDQNDQYSWILDVIDTYTKHLWSFKLINKTAELVRDSLEFLFDNFGVLGAIHSNKSFNNPLFGSVIVQNEVSTMVPAIDIDPGIVLVEENAADTQWNLEIASDIHE